MSNRSGFSFPNMTGIKFSSAFLILLLNLCSIAAVTAANYGLVERGPIVGQESLTPAEEYQHSRSEPLRFRQSDPQESVSNFNDKTRGFPTSTYYDSAHAEYFRTVQQYMYNEQFNEADSANDAFIKVFPSDPAGYLFKAAVLLACMTEKEENLYPDSLKRFVDTVLHLSEGSYDSSKSAWMFLFRGHARSYRSLWESRFGSSLSSIRMGYKAKREYERGLAMDSSLYDLYLGLGAFHYWKSAKAGLLRSLHIMSDEKLKGIKELRLAVDSSLISRTSARNALIWIWLNCSELDSTISTCQQMLSQYPGSKLFLWPLAEAFYKKSEFKKSLEIFQNLRVRIAPVPGNYYNLIECDFRIYKCYRKLESPQKLSIAARVVRSYFDKIPKNIKKKQRSKIAELMRASRKK